MSTNRNTAVPVPKLVIGLVSGAATIIAGAAISWAVNVDNTQRALLQDVSGLKENRQHVADQLTRIEGKIDQLVDRIGDKLDQLLENR